MKTTFFKPTKRSFFLMITLLFFSTFCIAQNYNLTGIWYDDGGSLHRIRQVNNEIFWTVDALPKVINVFHGYISGSSISGQWADLPGGQQQNSGSLTIRIESNNRMVKTSSSFPYGSSYWIRTGGATAEALPFMGVWKNTDHIHQGCTNKQSFCHAYKRDLLFEKKDNGEIKVTLLNGEIWLNGTYDKSSMTYSFSLMRGNTAYGSGQLVFGPDFRSFTGHFKDDGGHRGVWNGYRLID